MWQLEETIPTSEGTLELLKYISLKFRGSLDGIVKRFKNLHGCLCHYIFDPV